MEILMFFWISFEKLSKYTGNFFFSIEQMNENNSDQIDQLSVINIIRKLYSWEKYTWPIWFTK